MNMKPINRMRRFSSSVESPPNESQEQSNVSKITNDGMHSLSSRSLDICGHANNVSESRIDRMRKLLTSPLAKRKSSSSSASYSSKVFGTPIEVIAHETATGDQPIPFIVSRICNYIEDTGGLDHEGLFRISGNAKLIEKLKLSFDTTGDAPLESEGDIASASALLKLFLRELPHPLVPESSSFLAAIKEYNEDRVACMASLKTLLVDLPHENYLTLKYLANFLSRVALNEDHNRMSSSSLGIVFGPNLFRACADSYQGLQEQAITNQLASLFITNYVELFGDKKPFGEEKVTNFSPLSVEIPSIDIEDFSLLSSAKVTFSFCTGRKRKEVKSHSNVRSNSEERPKVSQKDIIRKCNSQDSISKNANVNNISSETLSCLKNKIDYELSPQPTVAKRRELESQFLEISIEDDNKSQNIEDAFLTQEGCGCGPSKEYLKDMSNMQAYNMYSQAENATSEKKNSIPMYQLTCEDKHCDHHSASDHSDDEKDNDNDFKPNDSTQHSSYIPNLDNMTLDLKLLHENAGTNEPLLSEHRFSWPMVLVSHEKESTYFSQLNSQTISSSSSQNLFLQNLKKANSYEAPLSPSAYRGYLSQRKTHLDPAIPPSPPRDQDAIYSTAKRELEDHPSVRLINKRINTLKKKIKQFEQEFEKENGYRPSHEHKKTSSIANSYLIEMNKLKKELKDLKEEEHFTCLISENRSISDCDSNERSHLAKEHTSLGEMVDEIQKVLKEKRLMSLRPELIEDMTDEQICDEKLALQKELLRLENIFGRPNSKKDRDIVRPIYERYRYVKRIVSKISPQKVGNKDSIELQPILEHETLHVISPSHSRNDSFDESANTVKEKLSSPNADSFVKKSNQYHNLHEMPLFELKKQLQDTKQEKRNIRSLLRTFEKDFLRRTGRKIEKEDKSEMEKVYSNYKHIKGKVRLLEALIAKHQPIHI